MKEKCTKISVGNFYRNIHSDYIFYIDKPTISSLFTNVFDVYCITDGTKRSQLVFAEEMDICETTPELLNSVFLLKLNNI